MMDEQRAIRVKVIIPMPKDPTPEQIKAVIAVLNVDDFYAVLRRFWIPPEPDPETETL